jgi:4-amino-4-deoxy-L-arabinose transferase-like glycosyltransferase
VVSRDVFDRLPHLEDEVAYYWQAQVFARGQWIIPSPEARRSLWQPFLVDNAGSGEFRRFSKYTPGWSLTLAPGVALGQPWVVNAFLALLSTALLYRLGTEIFGRQVGAIAAALLAFSPAALLLNGSLMAHTAALFLTLVFTWAIWRMERGSRWRWALVGGLALGWMLVTRPASAVGVALPFVAWIGLRTLLVFAARAHWRVRLRRVSAYAAPYILLALLTISMNAVTYSYNAAATGDPRTNLYTLVWPYDKPGFGTCCGRSGHTLEKAFRHLRFDMSLAAADLYGWQANGWTNGTIPPELRTFLLQEASYWRPVGLSFVLLPFGILMGLFVWHRSSRRAQWRQVVALAGWGVGAVAWCVLPVTRFSPTMLTSPEWAWLWLAGGIAWLLWPVLLWGPHTTARWTWLLAAVAGCLVIVQMTYWVGSQRYSTRYWYEAIGAVSLLSALPVAWLLRQRALRLVTVGVFVLLLGWSYVNYSVPRVSVLKGFNEVSTKKLALLDAYRTDDRPVLLVVHGPSTGDQRVLWRAYSTYIAVTSPFLDSDVVAARVYTEEPAMRDALVALFPDRLIVEADAVGATLTFRTASDCENEHTECDAQQSPAD